MKPMTAMQITGKIGDVILSEREGIKATMRYPIPAVANMQKALPIHMIAAPNKFETKNLPALDRIKINAFQAAGQKCLLLMAIMM